MGTNFPCLAMAKMPIFVNLDAVFDDMFITQASMNFLKNMMN